MAVFVGGGVEVTIRVWEGFDLGVGLGLWVFLGTLVPASFPYCFRYKCINCWSKQMSTAPSRDKNVGSGFSRLGCILRQKLILKLS